MNTPLALSPLHQLANKLHYANEGKNRVDQVQISSELISAGRIFGLLYEDPQVWFKGESIRITPPAATVSVGTAGPTVVTGYSVQKIESLIKERTQARTNCDFATADKIRDELDQKGIVLEDGPDGTIWRRAG